MEQLLQAGFLVHLKPFPKKREDYILVSAMSARRMNTRMAQNT
jgi:hypothetical protein